MGYILKKSTGGAGGGDATAVNQVKQIDQLAENSGYPSVLKDLNNDKSVFLNGNNGTSVFISQIDASSVFEDSTQESTFKISNSSVFKNGGVGIAQISSNIDTQLSGLNTQVTLTNDYLKQSLTNSGNQFSVNTNVNVATFTNTTLAAVGTDLQNFLRGAGRKSIINISFSSSGVNQHDIICVYVNY